MKMKSPSEGKVVRSRMRRLEAIVLVLGCIVFAYAFSVFPKTTAAEEPSVAMTPVAGEMGDFGKFPHTNPTHTRLPCLLCHRRDDNSPRIKRSTGHSPCSGCHQEQFADNTSPMCTICHNPGSVAVKPFPSLRSFNVKFAHSQHTNQTSCATCHKSQGRGVGFSVPTGANAHNTCFQCHTANKMIGEKNISSCDTCHSLGRPNRGSDWAKAYKVNFSHQKHIVGGKMNCTACHTVRAGSGNKQVSAPLASMHFAPASALSCASCHNNKRAFGPPDFADCKRCHTGKGFKF